MIKLTDKQIKELWWGVWPYSEAKLVFETRIIDNHISRTFINVIVAINPTTFEICQQNMKKFQWVAIIEELFWYAENKWEGYWYISKVFSIQYDRNNSEETTNAFKQAQIALEYSEKAIISLHKFVIEFLEIDLESLKNN